MPIYSNVMDRTGGGAAFGRAPPVGVNHLRIYGHGVGFSLCGLGGPISSKICQLGPVRNLVSRHVSAVLSFFPDRVPKYAFGQQTSRQARYRRHRQIRRIRDPDAMEDVPDQVSAKGPETKSNFCLPEQS